MNAMEWLAQIGADDLDSLPVPTLDDYTPVLAELARRDSSALVTIVPVLSISPTIVYQQVNQSGAVGIQGDSNSLTWNMKYDDSAHDYAVRAGWVKK